MERDDSSRVESEITREEVVEDESEVGVREKGVAREKRDRLHQTRRVVSVEKRELTPQLRASLSISTNIREFVSNSE